MLLSIIFQITDQIPTDAVEKVSTLITDQGASTVGLAIVLVCFLIMFISLIRRNNLSESMMKEQLSAIQKMSGNMDKVSYVLENHTKILDTLMVGITDEISPSQLEEISDLLFSKSLSETMDNLDQIIQENHIQDSEKIKLKINNICSNLYSSTRERAINFKFKGHPLSYFLKSEWRDRVSDTMIKSIYANGGYNKKIAKTDMSIIFDQMRSDFMNNVYLNTNQK